MKNTHRKKTQTKLKEQPRKNAVRIRHFAHINWERADDKKNIVGGTGYLLNL